MTGFRAVAAYAPQGVTAMSVGIVRAIFDREGFEFGICASHPGHVRTDLGLDLVVEHGLELIGRADLVIVLATDQFGVDPHDGVLAALRAAYARGATVAATCLGTFLLAQSGLLEGRTATTHWMFAGDLASEYPQVTVRPDELYVDEGRIVTGAGAASAMDLCLYLLRRDHGAGLANQVARHLVTPPHRDGGQGQYFDAPVPADGDDDRLNAVLMWARDHLDQKLSVEDLAGRALMSPRSFARRFKAATGSTPGAWILAQRLNLAEQLLETTDFAVEEIARKVGYGSAATMREQFILRRGVAPRDYRRTFAG